MVSHFHLVLHVLRRTVYGILLLFRFPSTHKLLTWDTPCSAVCGLDIAPLRISSFTRGQCSLKVSIVESAPPRDRLFWLRPKGRFPIVLKFPAPLDFLPKSYAFRRILISAIKLDALVHIHIRVVVQLRSSPALSVKLKVESLDLRLVLLLWKHGSGFIGIRTEGVGCLCA